MFFGGCSVEFINPPNSLCHKYLHLSQKDTGSDMARDKTGKLRGQAGQLSDAEACALSRPCAASHFQDPNPHEWSGCPRTHKAFSFGFQAP